MANVFETVILNMQESGMFQFMLPFMLSSAIFYGLLRKSQIFGDPKLSVTVNAVVALVASFMVWSAPILLGIDIETALASFFVQGMMATLVLVIGLMIVSLFFPPNLAEHLGKTLNTKTAVAGFLIFGLLIGGAIFMSSGMIYFFIPKWAFDFYMSDDLIMSIIVTILLLGTVLIIVWGGGKGSSSS